MDPVQAALVGLAGVVVGAVLTAGLGEWRSRAAEQRASSRAVGDRVAAWQLGRLRQTRRQLDATIGQLEAMTKGDLAEYDRARAVARGNPDGNLAFVGDVDLIREVHDLYVFLNQRAGKGLEPDDQIRRIDVAGRAAAALDAQERRVLHGEPLIEVSKHAAPELFDVYRIAERLDMYAVPPSLTVRLATWLMRHFLLRRRGRG